MIPIKVVDKDINFLGEIDIYESLIFEKSFHEIGTFQIVLPFDKTTNSMLIEDHIVIIENDKFGIISSKEITITDTKKLIIKGYELKSIVSRRITVPRVNHSHYETKAKAGEVIRNLIIYNTKFFLHPDRRINNLDIGNLNDFKIGQEVEIKTRYKPLHEEIIRISKASNVGWDIVIKDNKYLLKVIESIDKTSNQDINPPILFSVEFDNIISLKYNKNNKGKNPAYVGGQGVGTKREIALINEEFKDLNRKEVFIDARDIKESNELINRGNEKLLNLKTIESFECEINPFSNFRYKEDWSLGDRVSIISKDINIKKDLVITKIKEVYESSGYKIHVTFGDKIPNILDKIKIISDQPQLEVNQI